ncbi:MAG TPA: PQQ-dependent sugar dehydrogenase [Leptospiraceae bacterium]|nr:PQQ-dependent sugar dehydrogenase [Leptospiraceae bacterium]HNF16439.1 PQQ-dependent sugar dehydrogenase [Leptospiraceae bacterium]HNF27230.1 PQQ-dependent sugar dehydrogenase [Leptospiraceae bacterium]HNI26863.1 PQQ-dependent sugar dehydrogenase [Leptospiraceae bacterium]HNI99121.1 PQQ-dependent sugar dehydrogenase [Leptospiraceae bacterium]
MKTSFLKLFTLLNFLIFFSAIQINQLKAEEITLEEISNELISPVGAAVPPGIPDEMYIIEQTGNIRLLKNKTLQKEPVFSVSGKLSKSFFSYSEKGLLGIAFHPEYVKNRKLYLYYSTSSEKKGSEHKSRISEFIMKNSGSEILNTEKIIMEIEQPESNHNGGSILFGKDGFLYIGTGDGGGAGDRHGKTGNSQDLSNLLGKILRIDVNSGNPYSVPESNPVIQGKKSEIYAYGLRNPWKVSMDRVSGEIFIGDVGQDKYEEIDILRKGANYGWRIKEGNHCFEKNCSDSGLTPPIHEYGREKGISVIGGYAYRADKKSRQYGWYIFGDWIGKIYSLRKNGSVWENETLEQKNPPAEFKHINSFAQDSSGDVYILGQKDVGVGNKGYIYKIRFAEK